MPRASRTKRQSAEVSLSDLAHLTKNGEAVPVRLPRGHRWLLGIVIACLGPLGAAGLWALKSHVETKTHLHDDTKHMRNGERGTLQTKAEAKEQHHFIRVTIGAELQRVRLEQQQADTTTHRKINELLTEVRRTRRTMERGGPP